MQVFSHQVARWVRPARLAVASIPLIVSAALGQAPVVPASAPAVVAARTPDATLIDVAPVIDGVLDDAAWTGTPLPTRDEWRSYNPLHGDAIPKQTTVWVTYDDKALYIAFSIFPDDWVGLSLDTLGTGQTSYHLMVNPSGIQLDMINTVSGHEDMSPDWSGTAPGHPPRPVTRSKSGCPCRCCAFVAATPSAWGSCSGDGPAALACRSPGRRCSRAAGSSIRTRR
ncbi:MAG: hypothetical protein H0V80_11775 [Acidobacteria bacterium]|nr:hypothetical protein [Acidobacteriota bacterium]